VRRRVVEKALVWLKNHNHLYANIEIDVAEMESWEEPAHGVPVQVYRCLERAEPSAWQRARTGQVVPPTERGLEERRGVDVREVLTMLHQGEDMEVALCGLEPSSSMSSGSGGKNLVRSSSACSV
jgi:hypothetical protein